MTTSREAKLARPRELYPHVHIVILNWNGWRDTIECLESVLRLDYPSKTIVVCDNGSSDGSLDQIRRWARGELLAEVENPELAHLVTPPVQKPIPLTELAAAEVCPRKDGADAELVLIDNGTNLGFAGGCNVGVRYALAQESMQYVWFLNNDTVVEPTALTRLVEEMEANARVGICGSTNLNYYSPSVVDALGGREYSRWTGRVKSSPRYTLSSICNIRPSRIDFVNGASMLVRRAFLERVGLMEEGYFLYFEELDWAARSQGIFNLGCTPESLIYHKEGASIGSSKNRESRSLLCEKYLSRNRVLFTRKYYPFLLPSVLFWVGLTAIHRAIKGDVGRAKVILESAVSGLFACKQSRKLEQSI